MIFEIIETTYRKIKNYFKGIKCPKCKSLNCFKRPMADITDGKEIWSDTIICFNCNGVYEAKD